MDDMLSSINNLNITFGFGLTNFVIVVLDTKQLYYFNVVFYLLGLQVNLIGSFLFNSIMNKLFREKYI